MIYWLPALIWAVVIFCLSGVPGDDLPSVPLPDIDKLAHVGVFGILCALLSRAIYAGGKTSLVGAITVACGLTICYGALDEWHQTFTDGRVLDFYDLLADAIGAIGCYTLLWVNKIKPDFIQWAMS